MILRAIVIWELRVVVLPYAWRKKNVTRWREQKLICCGWLDAKRELKTAKKYKFWISSRHFHELLLLFSACPPISKHMAGERSKKNITTSTFCCPTAYFCGNSLLNLWTDNNNKTGDRWSDIIIFVFLQSTPRSTANGRLVGAAEAQMRKMDSASYLSMSYRCRQWVACERGTGG